MRIKPIKHFFDEEFRQQAQYVNFSKIANIVSGSKVTAQKALSTIALENINNWQKVEVISSLTALNTLYLGGSSNIDGVITNIGSSYVGSNNITLISTKGDYGGRLNPAAAASRYIFAKKGEMFTKYFNKDDLKILPRYNFEGQDIEYAYFAYSVPMVLVNGTSGIGSGYKSSILPRSIDEIEAYIKYNLQGKNKTNKPFKNTPSFKQFKGTIEPGETEEQWIIKGSFKRINKTTLEITEVPIGETYISYNKKIEALLEAGIIKDYEDLCDPKGDIFKYTIKHDAKFSDKSDEDILKILKLISKESEQYVLNDENNSIKVFKNVNEIFWYYYKLKLSFLQSRKDYLLYKYDEDIRIDVSKYTFIKKIVENELIINKRKKDDIVKELEDIKNIISRDDNYDYLLNMSISTLTQERMEKLMHDIKDKKVLLDTIKATTVEQMWLDDLGEVK